MKFYCNNTLTTDRVSFDLAGKLIFAPFFPLFFPSLCFMSNSCMECERPLSLRRNSLAKAECPWPCLGELSPSVGEACFDFFFSLSSVAAFGVSLGLPLGSVLLWTSTLYKMNDNAQQCMHHTMVIKSKRCVRKK